MKQFVAGVAFGAVAVWIVQRKSENVAIVDRYDDVPTRIWTS